MKGSFYLIDIDYVTVNEEPVIRLFGKTINGEWLIALDKSFKPYFWALIDKKAAGIEKIEGVISVEEANKKFLGKDYKALKVTVKHPNDVKRVSDKVRLIKGVLDVKENDISFYKRYLIDKKLSQLTLLNVLGDELSAEGSNADRVVVVDKIEQAGMEGYDPKVLAFDIETYEKNIIMISVWSNFGLKKVLATKKCGKPECESYDDEEALIKAFISLIKKNSPEIIVTYNGDGFDWPYLKERAGKHRIKIDLGVDGSVIKLTRKAFNNAARIKGLVHLDLYQFVSNVLSASLKTNSLDLNSVAQELIGESKLKINWDDFFNNWKKGSINELIDYSINDSRVTYKLFDNLKALIFELTRLVNQPLFDVSRKTYSQLVEDYLMNRAQEFNELIPNKPSSNEVMSRRRVSYAGGFVFEPKPGIYEDLANLDFRSLYPSIMVSFNICPTTINQECSDYNTIKVNNTNYKFCKKGGFIPSIIKELVEKRGVIKKELKQNKNPLLEARSYALKTITNATYGFYGYPRARWYCFGCAESITSLGREFINKTINKASSEGFKVIYADTDGLYITREGRSKEAVFELMKSINKELPGIMELELDNFYPRGLFTTLRKEEKGAKKRYALIDEKGKIIVKGFEFVRGDWAEVAKKTQFKVFEALLKDKSEQKAIEVVRSTISKLRDGSASAEELIMRTQLTKPIESYKSINPHVAVAKRLIEKGLSVEPGMTIEYIVIEGKGRIRDKSVHVSEFKGKKYDPEYYINNQVLPAIDRIMKMLGIDEKSFERTEQKGLNTFF